MNNYQEFKTGDMVKIRQNIRIIDETNKRNNRYSVGITNQMEQLEGTKQIISYISGSGITLEGIDFVWSESLLEPTEPAQRILMKE